MFDNDRALTKASRMWRKLGELFEQRAYIEGKTGFRDVALGFAKAADVCFWQATGECDSINMKDLS